MLIYKICKKLSSVALLLIAGNICFAPTEPLISKPFDETASGQEVSDKSQKEVVSKKTEPVISKPSGQAPSGQAKQAVLQKNKFSRLGFAFSKSLLKKVIIGTASIGALIAAFVWYNNRNNTDQDAGSSANSAADAAGQADDNKFDNGARPGGDGMGRDNSGGGHSSNGYTGGFGGGGDNSGRNFSSSSKPGGSRSSTSEVRSDSFKQESTQNSQGYAKNLEFDSNHKAMPQSITHITTTDNMQISAEKK